MENRKEDPMKNYYELFTKRENLAKAAILGFSIFFILLQIGARF